MSLSTHRVFSACLSSLALLVLSVPLQAQSATPGSNPDAPPAAACFTYRFDNPHVTAQGFEATALHAALTGTAASMTSGSTTLKSESSHLSGKQLENFEATAAYVALTVFHGGVTPHCRDQKMAERQVDQSTHAHWSDVTFLESEHKLTLAQLDATMTPEQEQLHTIVTASGVHDSRSALVPSRFDADLLIQQHAARPHIVINALHAKSGASTLEGHGTFQPGTQPANSSLDLHLGITNVDALIAEARGKVPANVSTALTVARLMGKPDGDTTRWDIALANGMLSVNSVPLPVPLH